MLLKKHPRKWSWKSLDFNVKNEIDFILSNKPDIMKKTIGSKQNQLPKNNIIIL